MGKELLQRQGAKNPELQQCFFGEHLVARVSKPIGIVESEKTTIVMTLFSKMEIAPDLIWIATGGSNGTKWTNPNTLQILKNRQVILFPDLGVYDSWKSKAEQLKGISITVCDILETNASEANRIKGFDLADYYLHYYQHPNKRSLNNYPKLQKCYCFKK